MSVNSYKNSVPLRKSSNQNGSSVIQTASKQKQHKYRTMNKTPSQLSANMIFKKLVYLLNLKSDEKTIVKHFETQKLQVSIKQVKSWLLSSDNPNFKILPDDKLSVFIDALFSLRAECKNKEIFMFDCFEIFQDLREFNSAA